MATERRRATLIHNERAGDRRLGRAVLVELRESPGYSVSYSAAKRDDRAEALARPAELIIAAGGDGTVARVVRVARRAADRDPAARDRQQHRDVSRHYQ